MTLRKLRITKNREAAELFALIRNDEGLLDAIAPPVWKMWDALHEEFIAAGHADFDPSPLIVPAVSDLIIGAIKAKVLVLGRVESKSLRRKAQELDDLSRKAAMYCVADDLLCYVLQDYQSITKSDAFEVIDESEASDETADEFDLDRDYADITDAEHQSLVKAERAGKAQIGVDRAFARDFYLWEPLATIRAQTGESPYVEKLVAWSALIGAVASLLVSLGFLAWIAGGWSALLIPIAIVWWVGNFSMSVRGDSTILGPTFVLLGAVAAPVATTWLTPTQAWCVGSYAASLWCTRLLYTATTDFFRAFVLRNARAFRTFPGGVQVKHTSLH